MTWGPGSDRRMVAAMTAVAVAPFLFLILAGGQDHPWRATYYAAPDFGDAALVRGEARAGVADDRPLPEGTRSGDVMAVRWEADLLVREPGPAAFMLTSNGGSELRINDTPVITNWGLPDRPRRTRGAVVQLSPGWVRLEVSYLGLSRDPILTLEGSLDGARPEEIDPDLLRYPLDP